MDDDDAQFLVVELAAGVNCQELSETLGTQPFEHANYQWLVLGSTPAGNAVVAAVAGAEVAPEPTKRLAGWLQERLKAAGAAHGVAPYRMTGEAAPAPAPVQPAQRRPAPVQPAQRRARVAPARAATRSMRRDRAGIHASSSYADDSDPGLDTKARRIASRLVGGAGDVVAQFRELLRRAEVEPAVRLPPDTSADAVRRQAGRANPHRNRLLDGQRVDPGAG